MSNVNKIEAIQISGNIFTPSEAKLGLVTGTHIPSAEGTCAEGKVLILIERDMQISGTGSDLEGHSEGYMECVTPLKQGSWNYSSRSLAAQGATVKDWLDQKPISEWAEAIYHLVVD